MEANEKRALLLYIKAIVETVAEVDQTSPYGGVGTPGGHLYAALMSVMDLQSFNAVMGNLVKTGLLTHSNQCYFITPAGRTFLAKTEGML
jgi:hypothetical protein